MFVIDKTMSEILFVGYSLKPHLGFSYNFEELSDLLQKSVDYSNLNLNPAALRYR